MGLREVGVLVLVAFPAGALAAACSSTDSVPTAQPTSPGGCEAYVPPSTFTPSSPTVTFSADVLPLVTRSCAFESCHGSIEGPTGGMYLGADAPMTYASIVGVASLDVPSMLRVKPGDPANSFLQHKIDGDACAIATCTATCAESMPQGQDVMAVTDRLTIRAWIAQGALSDLPDLDGGQDAEQ